jgi:hypothetical protein
VSNETDEEILAFAAKAGLSIRPPYDQELLISYRSIRPLIRRLSREWHRDARPAFSFCAGTEDSE